MSTIELKNIAHSLIDTINDSATLQAIITLLKKNETVEKDWWSELSEANRESIERGLKDIELGKTISDSEARAKINEFKKQHP